MALSGHEMGGGRGGISMACGLQGQSAGTLRGKG